MKLVTNENTPWLCYTDPNSNLVWWVHSKCACSFYKIIFRKLGWIESNSAESKIWQDKIVFSHIRDPLVKHRIGIIEWFYFTKNIKLLQDNFENEKFFQMLSEIAYLDIHSMSIRDHLGSEKSSKIHWIPIDTNANHVEETINFIEQHTKIDLESKNFIMNLRPIHVSTDFKKQCNQKLLKIPPTPLIVKSLEHDRYLYDLVTRKNFEPSNYSNRISELKKQGLSQTQAEAQADLEVESGEYLQWTN